MTKLDNGDYMHKGWLIIGDKYRWEPYAIFAPDDSNMMPAAYAYTLEEASLVINERIPYTAERIK